MVLVVPCYNEAHRLNVDAFRNFQLAGHQIQFCFVNDGSVDGTLRMLESLRTEDPSRYAVLDLSRNGGKAEAVRRGVVAALPTPRALVFEGFSQGTAMAYRAASDHSRAAGLIALGGDVPPEVTSSLPPVLVGRGMRDDWYTQEKFEKDLKFLKTVTSVSSLVIDGGHEWTDDFRAAAAEFLQRLATF